MPDDKPLSPEENAKRHREEVWAAVQMAETLRDKSDAHRKVFGHYCDLADIYGLWDEVCWSAGLKEEMTSDEFDEALNHGCYEWDI